MGLKIEKLYIIMLLKKSASADFFISNNKFLYLCLQVYL